MTLFIWPSVIKWKVPSLFPLIIILSRKNQNMDFLWIMLLNFLQAWKTQRFIFFDVPTFLSIFWRDSTFSPDKPITLYDQIPCYCKLQLWQATGWTKYKKAPISTGPWPFNESCTIVEVCSTNLRKRYSINWIFVYATNEVDRTMIKGRNVNQYLKKYILTDPTQKVKPTKPTRSNASELT